MNLSNLIVEYLKSNSCLTQEQIMQAMEETVAAPRYITMIILKSLIGKGKVVAVPDKFFAGNKSETEFVVPMIGKCICGITSHHLIMGECPACIEKYDHGNSPSQKKILCHLENSFDKEFGVTS